MFDDGLGSKIYPISWHIPLISDSIPRLSFLNSRILKFFKSVKKSYRILRLEEQMQKAICECFLQNKTFIEFVELYKNKLVSCLSPENSDEVIGFKSIAAYR